MNSIQIETPVLFVGGLAMRSSELNELGNSLNKYYKYPFLTFDNLNVGSGLRLDNVSNPLTIEEQAKYQWDLVDKKIGNSDDKISIFGISMGGMIAATMAFLKPHRVSNLILAATSVNSKVLPAVPNEMYSNWISAKTAEDIMNSVKIAIGRTTNSERPEVLKKYFEYRISGSNGQKPRDFISQLDSVRKFDGDLVYSEIAKLNLKVTIVNGEEDTLFNSQHAELMSQMLPNARVVTLSKTGHMLHLENPSELSKQVYHALIN